MRTSITFGHVSGIPLKVHLNWLLTAGLVTWSLAGGYFPQEYPNWSRAAYWTIGALTALLFFGSVLLHELGHAWVALRENVPVLSITLFVFGGVAHIEHDPRTPGAEFRIVMAGPFTSLLLAFFFGLVGLMEFLGSQITGPAIYLSQLNFILAVFNMIPGFPLDGGRVLRALLWKWINDYSRATRWATRTGLGVAFLFVTSGIILMVVGEFISGLWVAFIGWYLSTAAQEGYRQADAHEEQPANWPDPPPLPYRQGEAPLAPSKLKLSSGQNAYGSTYMLVGMGARKSGPPGSDSQSDQSGATSAGRTSGKPCAEQ